MAELLLELLTEEIPARMQMQAMEDLRHRAFEKLKSSDLDFSEIRSFVTPRRLTLVVDGLPLKQPDTTEERRGPRVGAPQPAIEGFLKSVGLTSIDQCEEKDTGKGVFYFANIRRTGASTELFLHALLRKLIVEFPWPKSMRFPAANFQWVRPLNKVLCLFDDTVIDLSLDHVSTGDTTQGHRFLAPAPIKVKNFADYARKLRAANVVLDPVERELTITDQITKAVNATGLEWKADHSLLSEVVGLVEWPVVLMGAIDPAFLDLPPEVLMTSMRAHQKYFACLDRAGKLAPRFLLVSNMVADDGGKAIVAGNERVLRARLSDARFFWEQDRKVKLAARVPKLAERVFHAKLGSVLDKVRRTKGLVEELVERLQGIPDRTYALRAAELAKADLSTGMVGEFPELQGVMGRYYALNDGEPPEVADAIAQHYSPLGPNDRCPTAPVSVVVALADKIDTLVGFFSIDEKPTGSKDPYALRRAALGVIRLVLENNLRLPLAHIFSTARNLYESKQIPDTVEGATVLDLERGPLGVRTGWQSLVDLPPAEKVASELLSFLADRLKVHLREQGVRHDLIAAVFALGNEDDLVRLLARVAALDAFLETEDGANLLVAYRRAANIVRIEEKKDGRSYAEPPDPKLLAEPAEATLAVALEQARARSAAALEREAFTEAMAALAVLRLPVDEFFARVTVNCDNRGLRGNRLRLLARIRDTLNQVADFSQIEG